MPIISVILPVFNMEKYIDRCVNSVIGQSFSDWELILVDDGSTDGSGNICDEYAKKDSRIRVIHKKNGGVASARQIGTDEAEGKYSIHCDADDWIDSNMLENMYSEAQKEDADIVVSNFYYNYSNDRECLYKVKVPLVAQDFIKEILYGNSFGGLCHKLIRHSLYKKYNIRYIEGVNYCEDVLVLAQLLKNDLHIRYIDKAYYHYCLENEDSITRNYTLKTYLMRQKSVKALREILPEKGYHKAIEYFTLLVKWEAVQKGVIKWFEINRCQDYMKTSISAPFVKGFAIRNKVKYVIWYLFGFIYK